MSESHEPTVIVDTLNGAVKGKIIQTCFGDEVTVFHKIPYMQPPIGKLRFKNPKPIENWSGIVDGTTEGPLFCQYDPRSDKIIGKEDALYINAYTKNLKSDKLNPVIVFIHGGAFVFGSPNRDEHSPDYLLRKDIVYFSMSYRLGCLGFLSLDDPDVEIPGNAGLKDQTMALKWIKNNAHVFGGDSNNITLFGQSAGGASAQYHLISDFSKGLFHKAIVTSGSAISEWALQPKKRVDYSLHLIKKYGWNENKSMKEAVDRLQNASFEEVIEAQNKLITKDDSKIDFVILFVPSVESYVSDQCFLNRSPMELIKNPWSNNLPLIIGGNPDEGLMFVWVNPVLRTKEAYENKNLLASLYNVHSDIKENTPEYNKFGEAIKKAYYGEEQPTIDNTQKLVNLLTDKMFWYGMHETIKYRVNNSNDSGPTYVYRFNFDNDFCSNKVIFSDSSSEKGVTHGGEMPFLFQTQHYDRFGGLTKGTIEYKMMEQMVGMWTNFASNGNPNCQEIGCDIWKPVTSKAPPYKVLDISEELNYIDLPETARLQGMHKVWSKF